MKNNWDMSKRVLAVIKNSLYLGQLPFKWLYNITTLKDTNYAEIHNGDFSPLSLSLFALFYLFHICTFSFTMLSKQRLGNFLTVSYLQKLLEQLFISSRHELLNGGVNLAPIYWTQKTNAIWRVNQYCLANMLE